MLRLLSLERRFTAYLSIFFCIVILLPVNGLAKSASEQIRSSNQENVSRGDFLRGVVYSLGLEKENTNSLLLKKFTRVPKGFEKYVSIAQKRGALSIFGGDLQLSRGITRQQAVFLMVKMSDFKISNNELNFIDIDKNSDSAKTISVAVEKQWFKSVSDEIFGSDLFVTGAEAKRVLRALEREMSPNKKVIPIYNKGDNTDIPTVQINLTTKSYISGNLPEEEILQSVWKLIQEQYLYDEKIDNKNVAYSIAESLMEALDDPYSIFMRPASSKNFQTQINGSVSGIGAQVEMKDGILTIITPLSGSPAEQAGLKPGDKIIMADGVDLTNLGFIEAVEHVRGPENSTVKLTIRRDGIVFEKKVLRKVVQVPEIEITWHRDIAIVKIMQFGHLTDTELRAEMFRIQEQNPSGIIVDLRNNPGGLLHAASAVVSNFVPRGTVVAKVVSRHSTRSERTDNSPTISENVPVVVLINAGSASASEIVAGALQDLKRATIIGETSFGKGTVQQVVQFYDDSSMKMTIAEWLTPNDRKIDGNGVKPDIFVESGERDPQMLKALDVLKNISRR